MAEKEWNKIGTITVRTLTITFEDDTFITIKQVLPNLES
jgi:hypothetical protein